MVGVRSAVLAALLVASCLAAAVPVTTPASTRAATTASPACSTHGEYDAASAVCICEQGFTGANCEMVVVTGRMLYEHKSPVSNCAVKVYGTDDINANENLLGEGACNADGVYSIVVPHRHLYVVSGKNHRGTENRQFFFVPATKTHRDQKNTRTRRSHLSNWQNPSLNVPGYMLGEWWYAQIFWGWDHTGATCDLNLNVHTPWPLTQFGYVNGCTTDTWYNTAMCQAQNNSDEHYARPFTGDSSCNSNDYGYGFENFYIYEAGQSVPFEIFTYNPDLHNGNYQNFKTPGYQTVQLQAQDSVFAVASLYNADDSGWAQLLSTVDIKQATGSLSPGLYWHIWSLTVDTIPANVGQFAAGNGTWTVHNTVSCSPLNMVYSSGRQPWEPAGTRLYRGDACGLQN